MSNPEAVMASARLISLTILSWNCWPLIQRCIQSIKDNPPEQGYEIIVVDNGSSDATVDNLKHYFPTVQIISNQRNLGVGPARNQAMKQARGEYIINLDADIVVLPQGFNSLISFMDKHSEVGLAGPKLLYPNGELQYSCRKFPSIFSKISRRIRNPIGDRLLRREFYYDWDHKEARSVDYVIGACQIIRRHAYEDVGGYDPHIFYGPEDIEYCWRIARSGYQVWYVPDAQLIHDEQRITKKKIFTKIMLKHAIGLIYYFAKIRYSVMVCKSVITKTKVGK